MLNKSEDSVEKNFRELINYQKIKIKSKNHLSEIFAEKGFGITEEKVSKILRTLNRKEKRFFRVGDSIIVPDKFHENLLAYSLFPQIYPASNDLPKIIMVSNKYQSYACYEFGKLVRFAACNSGKETTPTYPGRYALNWRERLHRSSLDETWIMPFTFNFHLWAGSAFHKFDMPGRPASHSCIRNFMEDAEWIYNWGKMADKDEKKRWIPFTGTPVIILDIFDFSRKRYGPWIELTNNQKLIELPEKPMDVEDALIPIKQIPVSSRGSLKNKNRYIYAEDTLRARGLIRPEVVLRTSVNFGALRKAKKEKQLQETLIKPS